MIAHNSGSMICWINHQLPAKFIKVSAQHFLVETRKKNSANELHPAGALLFFFLDIPRNRPRSITIVLWIGISGTPEFGARIHENKHRRVANSITQFTNFSVFARYASATELKTSRQATFALRTVWGSEKLSHLFHGTSHGWEPTEFVVTLPKS